MGNFWLNLALLVDPSPNPSQPRARNWAEETPAGKRPPYGGREDVPLSLVTSTPARKMPLQRRGSIKPGCQYPGGTAAHHRFNARQ